MANNTLTKQEQEELFRLGEDIQAGLSCDVNGTGIPCRTDRLDAVAVSYTHLTLPTSELV